MPKFFLETNSFFNWIDDDFELELALDMLKKEKYDLEKIFSLTEESDRIEFGTRREHKGRIKLLDWLEQYDIDVSEYRNDN